MSHLMFLFKPDSLHTFENRNIKHSRKSAFSNFKINLYLEYFSIKNDVRC